MKSKKKRTARILVAMLLVLTMVVFAGCGNKDDLSDGVNDNNTPIADPNGGVDTQDNMLDDNTLNDNGTVNDQNGTNGTNTTDGGVNNTNNNAVQ